MRSFILTAATAAALVVTSFTISDAAMSGGRSSGSQRSAAEKASRTEHALGEAEQRGRAWGSRNLNGQSDPVPPVVIYPRGWMAERQLAPHGERLVRIETELGHAMHRINVDRRLGELTSHEARIARSEDRSVRAEAVAIARQHEGAIPHSSYAMLQGRVAHLDRQIDREATGRG
jgi:hypothetical protein